jgi:hypothetical protein
VNLLIQTRGLHTLPGDFFEFSGCREARETGKVEKMGNLQVTPLHRGHRREGAVLLRKRGVGRMSFSTEKVGSDYVAYVEEDGM